jgi:hypothetical protein
MDLIHVAVGRGDGILRTAAVLTRVHIGGVPIPPAMRGVRLLVMAVMFLRLVQELGKGGNVHC